MLEQESPLIRRPLLTGHQSIDGMWLPAERFALQERARLMLEHWRTGAMAYRFADGDLVQFSSPVALDCQALAGWPLVRQGRGLCSAQLSAEELRALPAADLWLVRGSQVHALQFAMPRPWNLGSGLISAPTPCSIPSIVMRPSCRPCLSR